VIKNAIILILLFSPLMLMASQNPGTQGILEKSAEPDVAIITEFSFEKNAIRFPGEYRIIEAYINKKGKRFLRSEIMVACRNYKFFSVEVKTDGTEIK